MPISVNKIVHTMGKRKSGGVSGGFSISANASIAGIVISAEIIPVPRLMARLIPSFFQSILCTDNIISLQKNTPALLYGAGVVFIL